MKVVSTNIATSQTIQWKGKQEQTGIYKKSVPCIQLENEDVKNDVVVDRKYHGGIDKACYLYSTDHYAHWKKKFPELDWHWGMFGENLSIEGLHETSIYIGDTYKIGEAIIQISEPRLPCYKLGIRFNDSSIIKEFTNSSYSGAYARVIKSGTVKPGETLCLIEKGDNLKLSELYLALTTAKNDPTLKTKILADEAISEDIKSKFV